MNRVCISIDQKNIVFRVASDFPIRCLLINEHCPPDCIHELMPDGGQLLFGVEHVQEMLGDNVIGPINDDRKPPTTTPTEAPYERWREKDSFGLAVWDVILAYSGVIDDDEMREELEDVLQMYYELNGDGTGQEVPQRIYRIVSSDEDDGTAGSA